MDIFHWNIGRWLGNRRFIRLGFWGLKSEREKHLYQKPPSDDQSLLRAWVYRRYATCPQRQ